jgi:hypothetical protein
MALRRIRVGLLDSLTKPFVRYNGAFCHLCNRPADSEEIVERSGPSAIKVLVRHHGAEELATFELGTVEWDESDVARAMRGHLWFAPAEGHLGK